MIIRRAISFSGAALLAASVALLAAAPTFWTVSTQADLLKGDVEDLSIDSDGRMFPGPSASLLAETAAPFLRTARCGPGAAMKARS